MNGVLTNNACSNPAVVYQVVVDNDKYYRNAYGSSENCSEENFTKNVKAVDVCL